MPRGGSIDVRADRRAAADRRWHRQRGEPPGAVLMDAARPPIRVGLWAAMPEPLVLEAAAKAGPDWVGLDLQHGAWDLGSAFRAIQLLDALGVPVLVRVAEVDLPLIPRVLDHGASGVVIAMASSVALVESAIALARYQP